MQTIAFFGASTGCGLSALKSSLAAGNTCIALCRKPSKLESLSATYPTNLVVRKGNAHDEDSVMSCVSHNGKIVDAVSFSIGAAPQKNLTLDDPHVCQRGIETLLASLRRLREEKGMSGRPLIVVLSSTGVSDVMGDVPLLMIPLYRVLLATPHADKRILEKAVIASGERFVIVRPSFFVDGDNETKKVRVAIEDVKEKRVDVKEVGYTISRAAVGRWMFENLLQPAATGRTVENEDKAVSLTW